MKKPRLLSTVIPFALTSAVAFGAPTPSNSAQEMASGTVQVYTTAKDSDQRLSPGDTLQLTPAQQPLERDSFVYVDPQNKFQTLVGIGGALTDASAEVFYKLPKDQQQAVLEAYFSRDKGIGYTFTRTNMASCDFSSDMYDYVDEGDKDLSSFNIAHDEQYKLPFIKEVMAAIGEEDFKIFVSPWSPPAWMKTNGERKHGGTLKPEFYDAWANYFVKYIQAFEARGVPVWGLSVQNEPMAVQIWDSCVYTAEQERDFIRDHLGPTLERAGMGDRELIAWDHNRDLMYHRASVILNDPQAAQYVDAIGMHWYEYLGGRQMQFGNEALVNAAFPDVDIIFTEGCADTYNAAEVNDWELGERYGHSMIHDFNNGTVAWTDWNVLLDERGGPNHVGNFCFAPMHADLSKGTLFYTNSYYYIGHFSKFIRPGAKRLATSSNRTALEATSFQNTDGSIVVVVMNRTDDDLPYDLLVQDKGVKVTAKTRSIMSLVVQP